MKKSIIITVVSFLLIILFLINIQSYAVSFNPDTWNPKGNSEIANDGETLKKFGNEIIGGIQTVGTGISVIALIIIGIKYMMGSVEEKAEYKKTLKPYLIGAIMVFGITNLLVIIESIVQNFA